MSCRATPRPAKQERGKLARAVSWKNAISMQPGLKWLFRMLRVMLSSRYRSEMRLQRDKPHNLFQPYGTTSFDRFPEFFNYVSKQLAANAVPRLLSFGCSTGEVVFTLRGYFADAGIAGIDLNPRSIAICRKKLERSRDPPIRFALAGTPDAEPESHFGKEIV